MRYFYLTLLILSLKTIQASIHSDLENNVLSVLKVPREDKEDLVIPKSRRIMRYFINNNLRDAKDLKRRKEDLNEESREDKEDRSIIRYIKNIKQEDAKDKKSAYYKARILKRSRTHEKDIARDISPSKLTDHIEKSISKEHFYMDPVLNDLRLQTIRDLREFRDFRRKCESSEESSESSTDESDTSDDTSDTSDLDKQFWKEQWNENWMQKKFEALNSTQPRGDTVNMVAARPWGVPCGDPNQHDMPWGSCLLPAECDSEYRIYRGDYFCGRTSFVCCSLLLTSYDMYQGLDKSFEDSSFSTDSNEKRDQKAYEKRKERKRRAEKKKRKKERDDRKRKIRKSIKTIVKEIKKILDRAYRNGTTQRKKKTKELKKFIEMMKKQYRKDRKSVVNVHEHEMVKIDTKLQAKLNQIGDMNQAFMRNDTYRDIIVNGKVNKRKLARFIRSDPKLAKLFTKRRLGSDEIKMQKENLEIEDKNPKTLEYDVEYGMLYY